MRKYSILMLCFFPAISFAGNTSDNNVQNLSLAGGIASPSFSTAVFQNPAGLAQNSGFNIAVQGAYDSGSINTATLQPGLIYGSQAFGAAAGINYGMSGPTTSAYYGAAVGITAIKTSIGLSGNTGLSPSSGSNFNLGVLINPVKPITLGFTLVGLTSSSKEIGAGVKVQVAPIAAVVVDATANQTFSSLSAKPGLQVGTSAAGLTVSYGLGSSSTQIDNGISVGGNLKLGNSILLQGYYNHLNLVNVALTIRL